MRELRWERSCSRPSSPVRDRRRPLHRAVRTAEAAEDAGLDAVWLAEHHFVPYGVCPSAVTLAALLLGRTRRIRVGTAVSVLPTAHPVALGEQAALLHLTSGGRFTLGVGRGGPWVDLEVFGARDRRVRARASPSRWTCCCAGCASPGSVRTGRGSASARSRWCRAATEPRACGAAAGGGRLHLPGDRRAAGRRARRCRCCWGCTAATRTKAAMVAGCGARTALAAGHSPEEVASAAARHVSAGVVQIADTARDAVETLRKAMPGWLRQGLAAHVHGRRPGPADAGPDAYTDLLCALHPVGTAAAVRGPAGGDRRADRDHPLRPAGRGLAATWRHTEDNVTRLGAEVLPLLTLSRPGTAAAATAARCSTRRAPERPAQQSRSSRRLVQQLPADRGEAGVALVDRGVEREHRDPVAVLEGEAHPEVPLQRTADRVTRQRAQQLAACLLVRRRHLVVGELSAVDLQLGHQRADHLPGVGQGGPDAVDELGFVDLASLGLVRAGPVRRRATWVLLSRPRVARGLTGREGGRRRMRPRTGGLPLSTVGV